MTIDDVRAAAEKAKAWRPDVCRDWHGSHSPCDDSAACEGAQRAVEDIANHVNEAVRYCCIGDMKLYKGQNEAAYAARIASYFCSEPNPVSEFRDAVRKFVETA